MTARAYLGVTGLLAVGVAVAACASSSTSASTPTTVTNPSAAKPAGSWPYPNGDPENTRDAAGSTISSANVASLQQAWTFKLPTAEVPSGPSFGSLAATPIVTNGVAYPPVLPRRRNRHTDLESLASGFLTGKYTRDNPTGGGGRRSTFSLPPIDLERGYPVIETMQGIAKEHNISVAHVAYAWVLAKPEVSSIIVGASRPEQLAGNLAAADVSLTGTSIAALDAVNAPAAIYPEPGWWTTGS